MAPNSPACCFIHASIAGSRSTAPLNRSNSVLIVAPFSVFGIYGCVPPLTYAGKSNRHLTPRRLRGENEKRVRSLLTAGNGMVGPPSPTRQSGGGFRVRQQHA